MGYIDSKRIKTLYISDAKIVKSFRTKQEAQTNQCKNTCKKDFYRFIYGVISLNPKPRMGTKNPLQQDIAISSVSLKWSFCLYGFYFIMVLHIFVC